MALEQRLNLRMSQKLIMTPSLQQAIKLLQLSKLELVNEINQELEQNPVLEEGLETMAPKQLEGNPAPDKDKAAGEAARERGSGDEDDYEAFWRDYLDRGYEPRGPAEPLDGPSFEATLTKQENLTDHLTWQMEMTPTDDLQRTIAEAIIGNLNDDGYLDATLEELRRMGEGDGYPAPAVEKALHLVQSFDPPGVAARDLSECLALQLARLSLGGTMAEVIVRGHLDLLQGHRYADLAARLNCSLEEVQRHVEVIKHLDPSPGLKYNSNRSQYVTPDVYVVKDDLGEYKVVLNEDGLPRLRISQTYRKMLERGAQLADREAKEFVREKFRSAVRLIKSLDERQRTIMKVAVSLVKHQREFLDHGIERMRPLRLRDVADDIQMHESTVSRVVRNKYMYTPRGLYEMRYFFHASVPDDRGGEVSSLSVKQKIKEIVEGEDGASPLSDAAIVKILEQTHGVKVARRTVAKYRGELRILSSADRKSPFA
ncbi:MAG TPA: RNA polymerase factor sigma-54 [Candidatus Polarisedimenticolia bacterium]|nr:RNA polymerase factor sigma-54 [Candidatus Polarisedimenticolia bacterium]